MMRAYSCTYKQAHGVEALRPCFQDLASRFQLAGVRRFVGVDAFSPVAAPTGPSKDLTSFGIVPRPVERVFLTGAHLIIVAGNGFLKVS